MKVVKKMSQTPQEEEIQLNKRIIFSSQKDKYPEIKGELVIRDNGFSYLDVSVTTVNDYAPASNTREYEKISLFIDGGSKIEAEHQYEYLYPSFDANYEKISLTQKYSIKADIGYPEYWEEMWLSECTEKEWKHDPEGCREHHEFLKELSENKIDLEIFKRMLEELLDNLTPYIRDDEDDYKFDNGDKFVAQVLQFIKQKLADKITNVKVEDIKE